MKYGLTCTTPPRMSAPSSVCSDDSFEIVNNELEVEESKDDAPSMYKPKVTFHEVFDIYPMDADIVARVTFDNDYAKSENDTVAVLPIAWKSVDQALCAAKIDENHVRFDVKELPKTGAEDKFYQLCYCTEGKDVMGVSIPFSFREVHEDELMEFPKECNKEFWTFRSRFAVLMDIYWNFIVESKAKIDLLKNETQAGENTETLEALDNEKKFNAPETYRESTSKILLFQIMKSELEEAKKQYEEEQKKNEALLRLLAEEQEKIEEVSSILQNCRPFSEEDRKICLEMVNKLKITYFSNSLMHFPGYHPLMLLRKETEYLRSLREPECKEMRVKNLLSILKDVISKSKFILCEEYPKYTESLRNMQSLSHTNFEEFDELIRLMVSKQTQSRQEANFNAEFIATPAGDILVSGVEQLSLDSPVPDVTNVSDNVPDDWKAEKAWLLEKCSKLENEITNQNEVIKGLKEQLINQEQSEVQKVITATSNVHEIYSNDWKKLVDTNKSLEELLRIKNEEFESLDERMSKMSACLSDKEVERFTTLEAKIARQNDVIKDLSARLMAKEDEVENGQLRKVNEILKDDVHKLVRTKEAKITEIHNLEKQLSESREILVQKEEAIANMATQLEKFNAHNCEGSNARRVAELEERLHAVYSTLWDERRETIKLRDDFQAAQARINSLTEEKMVPKATSCVVNQPEESSNIPAVELQCKLMQAVVNSTSKSVPQVVVQRSISKPGSSSVIELNLGAQDPENPEIASENFAAKMRTKRFICPTATVQTISCVPAKPTIISSFTRNGKEQSGIFQSPSIMAQKMVELTHQLSEAKKDVTAEKKIVLKLTEENHELKQQAKRTRDLHLRNTSSKVSEINKMREELNGLRRSRGDFEKAVEMKAAQKVAEVRTEYEAFKDSHVKTVADLEARLANAEMNGRLKEQAEALKNGHALQKVVDDLEVRLAEAETSKNRQEIDAIAKMVVQIETLKDEHAKAVADLEARLKEGAKQYAKLYVKYDRLTKRYSQSSNSSSPSLM